MRHLWRRLSRRCVVCGQRLCSEQTASERVSEINERVARQTTILKRAPLAQTCRECGQIVFEGERGFVQRYLLVDVI